jgi:hypothetical protein
MQPYIGSSNMIGGILGGVLETTSGKKNYPGYGMKKRTTKGTTKNDLYLVGDKIAKKNV